MKKWLLLCTLIVTVTASNLHCESQSEQLEIKASSQSPFPTWLQRLIEYTTALSAEEVPIDSQHECIIQ